MEGEDLVANFVAMTGCSSENTAIDYLSSADFDLANAVVQYQADNANNRAPSYPSSPPAQHSHGQPVHVVDCDRDEMSSVSGFREEVTPQTSVSNERSSYVAPPSVIDRLFQALPADNPVGVGGFPLPVDSTERRYQSVSGTPDYVCLNVPLQRVCQTAQQRGVWVLVSLRDDAFLSRCLARDVWNREAMVEVSPHFECVEYDVTSPVGEEHMHSLNASPSDIPCVFVLDPFTGRRERFLKPATARDGSLSGGELVRELAAFCRTNESPRESSSRGKGRTEGLHTAVVDVDAREDKDRREVSTNAAPTQPLSVVPEVNMEEWTLPASDESAFKLRVRLPKANPTLCLKPQTPISTLLSYLAYRVHADDPAAYPSPPAIEVRGGFPPKVILLPGTTAAPLTAWDGVRSGETLTVHIK